MINREATIHWKGYDPADLNISSNKRVWVNCDRCGDGRWISMCSHDSLCRSCSAIIRDSPPKPEFVLEKDRFITGTGIDRITTIEKMGYDPADLTFGSQRSVWCICQGCGKSRISCYASYSNLCESCGHKGYKHTDAARKKMLGRVSSMFGKRHTEDSKRKMRENRPNDGKGENNPRFGVFHTDATRKKMSDNHVDMSGFNNPNWQGGTSYGEYCPKFNEEIRERIRLKYNNKCYICRKRSYEKLCVHHVDMNKDQGCNDHKWQLIPVCRSCHSKLHGCYIKYFWMTLLKYSLQYEKEYYSITTKLNLLEI